ncbi:FecCD family ABC transporter permease [Blautia sp. Marseille-P3201T]|uniref:FecCD family ABC transporter permease n=1 Tax=Blautia sp. Marseille-P3201T TaxID=1907659 RepID=UPI00092FF400|nr:iron ABC transporter permease [Blautia sp. Marseille-P3201T]
MTKKKQKHWIFWLFLLFSLCFFSSFLLGRYPISPVELVKILFSKVFPISPTWDTQLETILFQIRLPRVFMAALIGGGLSCAGAVYQGIFQNPLVSPDVLGVSSGTGFGAALGLLLGFGYQAVSVSALCFGLLAVLVVYLISRRVKSSPTLALVLAGILISSLFSSSISLVKLVADTDNILPVITYWLMGSLASIRPDDVLFSAPLIILGLIPLYLFRWQMNIATLGDDEAKCMGISIQKIRFLVIFCATLITAAAVSVSGMIGWVGLIIPHIGRILVGNDYQKLLPASFLLGGSFLVITDNCARLLSTNEIPIGILTAFVGVPIFLYLILKKESNF